MKFSLYFLSLLYFLQLGIFASAQFLENKGQILNQYHQPNHDVLFICENGGMNVQLRKSGFSYDVFASCDESEEIRIERIDIDFKNANTDIGYERIGQSSAYCNFYTEGTGEQGVLGVHKYDKVVYHNVYKGIDVEFSFSISKGFEYNFVLSTEAQMSDIQMKYSGQQSIAIEQNQIHLGLLENELVEKIPFSYSASDLKPMDVFYHLKENVISFNSTMTMNGMACVIDPVPTLVYATYFGGSLADNANDMLELQGTFFVVGSTRSTSAIATSGAYQTTNSSNSTSGFIFASDSGHNLLWSTYFGSNSTVLESIVETENGNLFIAGSTSAQNMSTSDAFQSMLLGTTDVIFTTFDQTGVRLWSSYFGGTDADGALDVKIVNQNLVCLFSTSSVDLPTSIASYQSSFSGIFDGAIVNFDMTDWTINWITYFGGSGIDTAYDSEILDQSYLFVSGKTASSSGIATQGSAIETSTDTYNAYLAKFELATGNLLWSSYTGASSAPSFTGACISSDGTSIYSASYTDTDQLQVNDVSNSQIIGGGDMLITKWSTDGVRLWARYFGGNEYDDIGEILFADNKLYLFGASQSTSGLSTTGAYIENLVGARDNVIACFNDTGELNWSTYFGDSQNEGSGAQLEVVGNSLWVLDNSIKATTNPHPFATPDAMQYNNHGDGDVYLAQFDISNDLLEYENSALNINAYPNPTSDEVHLNLPSIGNWTLAVYDQKGALVQSEKINGNQISISIRQCPAGIYSVVAFSANQSCRVQVIKE